MILQGEKAAWLSKGKMQCPVLRPKEVGLVHLDPREPLFLPLILSDLSSPSTGSPESFSFQSEELFSWRKFEMILAPSKPRLLSDTF